MHYALVNASVVDLRYKMREVLTAIRRGEVVNVKYRHKRIARIIPEKTGRQEDLMNHAFFGSAADARQTVYEHVRSLRKRRYRDL
jgi:antitoxin (DNA-binding transcriptional repressor) of toxin-antitoxin stability system